MLPTGANVLLLVFVLNFTVGDCFTRHLVLATPFNRQRASFSLSSNISGKRQQCFYTATKRIHLRSRETEIAAKKDDSDDQIQVKEGDRGDPESFVWIFGLVLPLWLIYISNQWSRSSIYYLVNFSDDANPFYAMNAAIGFSEGQYGVLASVAFTTLFAIASLGAGIASDRYNRKVLTLVAAIGWSVATLGTSLSSSYSEVVLWRIAMGLACAFSTPTAYTLIQQNVPKDRTALATSLYGTGVAFGGALAALSILLDNELGWQQAMVVISSFGFVSAVLCFFLLPDDPKVKEEAPIQTESMQQSKDENQMNPFLNDVTTAFSTTRVKWLYLGSFLRFCSGLCIGVWSAPYFRMIYPDNASEYAVAQALITAVAGSSSGLIGGATADWLTENAQGEDGIGRRLWVPVVGSVLAAPAWYFAIHETDSFQVAMAWLAVEYLVAECWFGPTISTLQATVGKKIGGTAQGLFTLTGAVANFAPTLLGFLYGQATGVTASSPELVDLLAFGVCFGYISSAACFALSASSPPLTVEVEGNNM
jgi:MFS family permease